MRARRKEIQKGGARTDKTGGRHRKRATNKKREGETWQGPAPMADDDKTAKRKARSLVQFMILGGAVPCVRQKTHQHVYNVYVYIYIYIFV